MNAVGGDLQRVALIYSKRRNDASTGRCLPFFILTVNHKEPKKVRPSGFDDSMRMGAAPYLVFITLLNRRES